MVVAYSTPDVFIAIDIVMLAVELMNNMIRYIHILFSTNNLFP